MKRRGGLSALDAGQTGESFRRVLSACARKELTFRHKADLRRARLGDGPPPGPRARRGQRAESSERAGNGGLDSRSVPDSENPRTMHGHDVVGFMSPWRRKHSVSYNQASV